VLHSLDAPLDAGAISVFVAELPKALPFDEIKIDQSYIRELGHSKDCAAIVKAVVHLGASLCITPTAEGVETSEQLCCVRERGCGEIQGYFFGKPQPLSEINEVLNGLSAGAALGLALSRQTAG
jgi:EAL domain-containing protein (putative c-di-GMP-specific phosphodiesterase class I)